MKNLQSVFQIAYKYLKDNGKFIIAHCRTRDKLKQHHKNINYQSPKPEPIPLDSEILKLCENIGSNKIKIEDKKYFYFEATKLSTKI